MRPRSFPLTAVFAVPVIAGLMAPAADARSKRAPEGPSAGYVTAESEGSKKLYKITPEGEAYLKPNRDMVEAIMDRLEAFGRRAAKTGRQSSIELWSRPASAAWQAAGRTPAIRR